MKRSWLLGAATVLAIQATWFGLVYFESRTDRFMAAILVMLFLAMNVAGVGACITAYMAPRRGFLLGLSMAPLTASLATLSNLLLAASDVHVDFAGFRGNVGLFGVSLAYGIFVSAVGGAIGSWMARKAAPATSVPVARGSPAIPGPAPPAGHI